MNKGDLKEMCNGRAQSNFKVEAVLNNQKQQKLHPAADVFLNHQLSWIDNESWKLHQSTNHLRANS
jgi:Holliday junction resolvase-like predicted endonuclease